MDSRVDRGRVSRPAFLVTFGTRTEQLYIVYEGRLVNRALGQYEGYPLEKSEWPSAFEGIDARS